MIYMMLSDDLDRKYDPLSQSLMKSVGSYEFISRALFELSMFDINQI